MTLTSLKIEVVPIPHTNHIPNSPSESQAITPDGVLRFVSLGNARDEKGFVEIWTAIQQIASEPWFSTCEFILQANAPYGIPSDVFEAIRSSGFANVRLIEHTIATDDYYALLQTADIVLLPYWRSIYQMRTSGVFVEALAAGNFGSKMPMTKDNGIITFLMCS